jgi:thiamine biosynthesis lipoprotein
MRGLGTTAIVAVTRSDALRSARRVLVRELRAFDLACSRFRDDSELAVVNRGAGRAVAAGGLLREAVHRALRAAAQTDGLVDPTVGRSLCALGYDRTFVHVELRDGRLIRPSFHCAGRWHEVEVDDEQGTIVVPTGAELDLGATAKAFAADRAAAAAARETGAGVLVSIGGDIAVGGRPPVGGWPVGIAHAHSTPADDVSARVALSSGGLASSGTRVRRWSTSAGWMHHIVDPRTGRPAHGPWATVSVAAATCVDANTASTAAIVLGAAAPAWLESRRLPARLAADDGGVVVVCGWPDDRPVAA